MARVFFPESKPDLPPCSSCGGQMVTEVREAPRRVLQETTPTFEAVVCSKCGRTPPPESG